MVEKFAKIDKSTPKVGVNGQMFANVRNSEQKRAVKNAFDFRFDIVYFRLQNGWLVGFGWDCQGWRGCVFFLTPIHRGWILFRLLCG